MIFTKMIGKTFDSVTMSNDSLTDDWMNFENKACRASFTGEPEHLCDVSIDILEVIGDIKDLEGSPILMAEEISGAPAAKPGHTPGGDTYTWTFYKFATSKGYVTVRWLGESNGYYSEEVTTGFYNFSTGQSERLE